MKSQFAVVIVVVLVLGMIAFAASGQTSKGAVMSSGSAGDWIDVTDPSRLPPPPSIQEIHGSSLSS